MSRIIVKNLPKTMKEERLRNMFATKGMITDFSLKYTKEGVFRRFAFIGYKSSEEADDAVKYFNKTFIDTSKIQVDLAKDLTDPTRARPWSKHSVGSSAYKKTVVKCKQTGLPKKKPEGNAAVTQTKKEGNSQKMKDLLGDLTEDPEFQEFLDLHKHRSTKATWGDDDVLPKTNKLVHFKADDCGSENQDCKENDCTESGDSATREDEELGDNSDGKSLPNTKDSNLKNVKKGLSDMEYLKSKVSKKLHKKLPLLPEDTDDIHSQGSCEETEEDVENSKLPEQKCDLVTVKMRGIPLNVKEKHIEEFFRPISIKSIRIPRNEKRKVVGVAFIRFGTEGEADLALKKNKATLSGQRVHLIKQVHGSDETVMKHADFQTEPVTDASIGQDIAESGRLYLRNLPYCCTEEDIEKYFEKYGPLTEARLPVDKLTLKNKGFAFVTYMLPENAVKAFSDLDGTVFQGRMLHILPARAKNETELESTDDLPFKKKREAQKKSMAGSSHNWNTLFLGPNAVADIMSEKYTIDKAAILDPESRESLGVRMALGETQIVRETKDFLSDHGIQLDAFSQPTTARSKTVMLAKNLPAGTLSAELEKIFSKYGTLGRLLLPPTGLTAIVEFLEPGEARAAFTNLAYTKFGRTPLYLEWAPTDVFKTELATTDLEHSAEGMASLEKPDKSPAPEQSSESDDEDAPGCTLFVKNLNFDTKDEGLFSAFSKVGVVKSATVAKKRDLKNPGNLLSMGYGFVKYRCKDDAQKALKSLQHCEIGGHRLELKISERAAVQRSAAVKRKKSTKAKKFESSKILVRNIAFEAKTKEVKELFSVFGEIKTIRIPKKLGGTGTHRGFGFVEFMTKEDAKKAFNELSQSTHLFGRRLVLEWADIEEDVDTIRKKTADHFFEGGSASKRLKKSAIIGELTAPTSK